MKRILLSILFIISAFLTVKAQDPRRHLPNSTPFEFFDVWFKNVIRLPKDTLAIADSGSVSVKNGKLYYKWGPWKQVSAAPATLNGIKSSADTLMLGDSLDRATIIRINSSLINGSRYNYLMLTNRDPGAYDPYPHMLTYTPSPFNIRLAYGDLYGDKDSTFYGGVGSFLKQIFRDSTSAEYGAGKRNEILAGMGLEAVGQWYPPRDTSVLKVGRDGQSGNELFAQFDIGNSWGYNIFVKPEATLPGFPISTIRSSIDFSRVSDNTRRKKMTGAGVSGFISMYKTYQTAINMSTYEAGNYTDSIFGYQAYGDAYRLISGATKAKTLAVWTAKNVFGMYVHPQYLYTNTTDNGYSFYAAGDTDILVNKGFAYFGPGTAPQRQNNTEGLRYRIYNNGRYWGQDSIHGFIVDGYGMSVQIPRSIGNEATTNYVMKDSVVTATIGTFMPDSRDSRYLYFRIEGFNSASYPDNSPGMYIRFETGANHNNVSRVSRNGNWTFGNGATALGYRWYKKATFDGSIAVLDTLTIKNIKVAPAGDTINYKSLVINSNGDVFQGNYGSGGGGGGGSVTAVSAGFGHSFTTITGSGAVANDTTFASGNAVTSMLRYLKYSDSAKAVFTPMSRTLTVLYGLTGGGDLSANRSFLVDSTSGGLQTFLRGMKIVDSMKVVNDARYWGTGLITGVSGSQTGSRLGTNNSVPIRIFTNGTQIAYFDSTKAQLVIGAATINNNDALIIRAVGASNYDGFRVFTSNLASSASYSSAGIQHAGSYDINLTSGGLSLSTVTGVLIGGSFTAPTAWLQIKAGTATAGQAAFKLTSGTDLATPEAGAFYYNGTRLGFSPSTTIKRFAMTNDVAPSNGQIPIGNGTDYTAANITSGGTITVTNGSSTINLDIPTTILNAGSNLGLGSITSGANVDNVSIVSGSYSFTRSYNVINFSAQFNVDPTASGTTTVFHFMPAITSNFSAATNAKGTITASAVTMSGEVTADATNDDMIATFISAGTSSVTITITGQYTVQ
jgi:hypothetical protein